MKERHVHQMKAAAAAAIGAIFFLAAMVSSAAAMGEQIIGKVVRSDSGNVLVADSGEYLLSGKPVANLTGKTVVADGDVEYGSTAKTLHVDTVRVLQPATRSAPADADGTARSG